jgi:gliding-associated putative ABC transporter substrate-binding component GldG
MVKWSSRKLGDFLWLLNAVLVVVLLNLWASYSFFRIDLTEEKRFSIKPQTRQILTDLEEEVYVEVYLEGDLNPAFKRFRKNIEETLEEFRIYSNDKIRYTFSDPSVAQGQKARSEFMADLAARGIQPTNVIDKRDGQRVEKIIFPGAIVSYGGYETGVMLLKGNKTASSEEVINQSVEGIEFELANAIVKLTRTGRKQIGFTTGHGELDSIALAAFHQELMEFYDVVPAPLTSADALEPLDLLVLAKPTQPFSTLEKYHLDQYIMRGGKVLFMLDRMEASMDSASHETALSIPYEINLDDQLFKYGVRVNADLIQDERGAMYPVITGQIGGKPQMQMIDWPFFPLINHYPDHPITRNLDAVLMRFVNSIDTVKAVGIKKTGLLFTSSRSRTLGSPVNISVNELRRNSGNIDYSSAHIPVAYLLEGKFTSLYKNRFLPEGVTETRAKEESEPTRILVISDGDIARNEINIRTRQPQPLGFDPFTNYTFANRDFLMNAVNFLIDENGLIQARTKEVMIRPLDKTRVTAEKTKWQIINMVLPVVALIAYGITRAWLRRRKFAQFGYAGKEE